VIDLTNPSEEAASETLSQLLDQLVMIQQVIDGATRRVAGLRKMVEALVEMFPALEDKLPEDFDENEPARPRGAAAAITVLRENAGNWFTVVGVLNLLERHEWVPKSSNPANAVRTALERLVEQGAIKKNRSTEGAVIYRVENYTDDEEPF